MEDRGAGSRGWRLPRAGAQHAQRGAPGRPCSLTWLGDAIQRAHEQREEGQRALVPQPRGRRRDEAQRHAALQLAGVGLVIGQPGHAPHQAPQGQAARRGLLCCRRLLRCLLSVVLVAAAAVALTLHVVALACTCSSCLLLLRRRRGAAAI